MTDIGVNGGKYSHEFMILADSMEREIVSCKTSYAKIEKQVFIMKIII